MRRRILLLTILQIFLFLPLMGQHPFSLSKDESGHYLISAKIYGRGVQAMLEAPIPALLVSREFYEDCLKDQSDVSLTPSKAKMRTQNELYEISFQGKGRIPFGDAFYDGPVFVLEDFQGMRIPVQYLRSSTGRGTITLDLEKGTMIVGGEGDGFQGARYPLRRDKKYGFPQIRAKVLLETEQGGHVLKGYLGVDFGNPMMLALLKQHSSTQKAIRKGLELQDALGKDGQVYAQFLLPESLELLGRRFNQVPVLVTDKMASMLQLGLLGLPFFDTPVFLDFDKGVMMVF